MVLCMNVEMGISLHSWHIALLVRGKMQNKRGEKFDACYSLSPVMLMTEKRYRMSKILQLSQTHR